MSNELARDGIYILIVRLLVTASYFLDARGNSVVRLSIDIGHVELDSVWPLFGSTLRFPAEPVARPVAGGRAAHHKPQRAAVGRTVEGDKPIWRRVGRRSDAAVPACPVFQISHEAKLPPGLADIVGRIASLASLADEFRIDRLPTGRHIQTDGIVTEVFDTVGSRWRPVARLVLDESRLTALIDRARALTPDVVHIHRYHTCPVLPHLLIELLQLLSGRTAHRQAHISLQRIFGINRIVPQTAYHVHAVFIAEEVLDEVVVVAQAHTERMAVHTVERVRQPLVVELHGRIILIGLPLGTHLPEHVQRRLAPVVHPAVLVVIVAVYLVLETVPYLVGHGLPATRGMGAVRKGQQTYHVVNTAAAGLPLGGIAQTDGHLVSVRLRLALIDGDKLQTVGVELEDLVGLDTKIICMNNPNNPTGAVIPEKMFDKIIKIAQKSGAYILCDEVYRGLEHNGIISKSVADIYEKGISTGSVSKVFSLAGLRLGWICAPKNVITEVNHQREYNTISVGILDDYFASVAIENKEKIIERNLSKILEGKNVLSKWLENESYCSCILPDGGTTSFVKYDMNIKSANLCKKLQEDTGVMILPGETMELDGYLRIGYGNNPDKLETALNIFSNWIRQQ